MRKFYARFPQYTAAVRRWLLMATVLGTVGCAAAPGTGLVFLSRDGCANTAILRANLDEALTSLGKSTDAYRFIDLATLPADDVRTGYGTPTILFDDRDIFGLPAPTPPLPTPT
jgi:hypothetical protein